MIKHGKAMDAPAVPVGNLPLLPESEFPWARFARREGRAEIFLLQGGRPEECPKGCYIYEQFDTAEEERAETALALYLEHKYLTDARMLEHPYGHFHGRGRNARWRAEMRRRGLVE